MRLINEIYIFFFNQFLLNNRLRRYFSIAAVFLMLLVTANVLFHDNFVSAQTGQPEDGQTTDEWIIEEGDSVYNSSEDITINDNIIINKGGKLTLRDVVLTFNDVGLGIMVEDGGELNMDSCEITTSDDSYSYSFEAFGKVLISKSKIFNTYTADDPATEDSTGGIVIHSSDSIIMDTEIFNPHQAEATFDQVKGVGISIIGCNPTVVNNSVHHVRIGITYHDAVYSSSPCTAFLDGSVSKTIMAEDGFESVEISLPSNVIVTDASFDIAALKRFSEQEITGAVGYDQVGRSFDMAEDMNGDGYPELIVGVPMHDSGGKYNNGKP